MVAAKPRTGVWGIQFSNVGDKLLKRIRVEETQPGMTRVVLDLESAIEFKAEQLTNPDRLVIELRAAGSRPISSAKPEGNDQPVAASATLDKPVIEQKVPAIYPIPAEPPAPPKPAPVVPAASALAAKRNANGDRTRIRALGLKIARVVIDPGHGGHDHGTTGPSGLHEKNPVLHVAPRLREII